MESSSSRVGTSSLGCGDSRATSSTTRQQMTSFASWTPDASPLKQRLGQPGRRGVTAGHSAACRRPQASVHAYVSRMEGRRLAPEGIRHGADSSMRTLVVRIDSQSLRARRESAWVIQLSRSGNSKSARLDGYQRPRTRRRGQCWPSAARRSGTHRENSRASALVRGVVLLDNSGGDPSSVGHFKALAPRPFTNGGEVRARPSGSRRPRTSRTTTSTTDLSSRIEVRLESLRHRGSILLRQVNRVVDAIERKGNLCCVLRAIEIVGDLSNRCFRHGPIVAGRGRSCLMFG